jgi:hypothetical protein
MLDRVRQELPYWEGPLVDAINEIINEAGEGG